MNLMNNILYKDGLFYKVIKQNKKTVGIQQLREDNYIEGTPEFIFNDYMYQFYHYSNNIDATKKVINASILKLHQYETLKENDASNYYIWYDGYSKSLCREYYKSDFYKCPDKLDNRIYIKKQINKIKENYDEELIEELVDYVGRKEFKIIELKKHMDIDEYMEWFRKHSKFLIEVNNLECPVCLEKGCNVGYYHCSHGVCSSCYKNWKRKANTCPTCRAK
jgi:hypothetical protein